MVEPMDMILPTLREMRAEAPRYDEELKSENAQRHAQLLARLDKLEAAQASFKQALTADTLLSRLVTGEFEQRIEALERKMSAFEGRAS